MTRAPAPAPGREGQTFAGDSRLAKYASFVKLPHTLFALPFAGVGALLASYAHPDGLSVRAALWIVVAFTAARFTAMGFNRIADREQDALNVYDVRATSEVTDRRRRSAGDAAAPSQR